MAVASAQSNSNPRADIYPPLDPTRQQVRFIEIIPSNDDEQPVGCLLQTVDLKQDLRYAALSYFWGDPNVTQDIVVNGVTLPVTTNLASALWHLREDGFPKNNETGEIQLLWVDAICINQDDVSERNHQVTLMAHLYHNATSVFSWLGPADSRHLDVMLQTIRGFALKTSSMLGKWDDDHATVVEAGRDWLISSLDRGDIDEFLVPFGELTECDYWKRIWIVQEMTLARSPSAHWFICGHIFITFEEMVVFDDLLPAIFKLPLPDSTRHAPHNVDVWGGLSTDASRAYLSVHGLNMAKSMKSLIPRESSRRAGAMSLSVNLLHTCIQMAFSTSATDPRDMVYAVLGLIYSKITPDYTKSVREVYLDAILSDGIAKTAGKCLQMSGRGYNLGNDHNLPSWVPDLTKMRYPLGVYFRDTREEVNSLLAGIELREPVIGLQGILRIQGVACGYVKRVKTFPLAVDRGFGDAFYQLSLEYLVEFAAPARISHGMTSNRRPLRALADVLEWENVRTRSKMSSHMGLELSRFTWGYWLVLIGGMEECATKDHWEETFERLGFSINSDFDTFIMSCLLDIEQLRLDPDAHEGYDNAVSYWNTIVYLYRYKKGITLFETDKNHLGIGPPGLQTGDLVCAIDKCSLPVLLRREQSPGDSVLPLVHVGTCYILGLSDGEPAEMVKRGELEIETFEIL
ncbi:heterokaryon incompatibility protein-domain-containing protein [Hypoxylon sp. FL1857]|nr:heterokaryon incompatibility protein-domain-containing protein [Hypoxylon sp. FL1857]